MNSLIVPNLSKIACPSDTEKMQRYVNEEKQIREENLRLQRKLQLEVERREALCRHLSESESRLVLNFTKLTLLHTI